MNVSHLGRLVGAGLLALGLSAVVQDAAARTFADASSWNCFVTCDESDADDVRGPSAIHAWKWDGTEPSGTRPQRMVTRESDTEVGDVVVVDATPPIAAPVPEPQTWALMAAGLIAVLFMGRRKRRD